jgi:hypothetical protein
VRRLARRRDEGGYVAVLTAIVFAALFCPLAATAVDTANWYMEAQKLQKAADAAALGGVVYMPQDFATATSTAKAISARNGFDDADPDITVTVAKGNSSSQLRVTVTDKVHNTFGSMFGVFATTISRTALADFTGPAPMGSPCNTFGNEPSGGGGASAPTPAGTAQGSSPFANCPRNPQFWAQVEGPETGKVQGDRFGTLHCEDSGVDGCDGSRNNTEYDPEGYIMLVKVQPQAVGKTIDLQLYDPAFVYSGPQCDALDPSSSFTSSSSYNNYVTSDAATRYSQSSASTSPSECSGDSFPGNGSGARTKHPMTTSFVLRNQTDSLDPMQATVTTDTSGKPCIKQYGAYNSTPTETQLKRKNSSGNVTSTYNDDLAKVFHNWVSMCKFTPARSGDYYLQVRTNVSTGGTPDSNTNGLSPLVYSGNTNAAAANGNTTSGEGANSFGVRAVDPGYEKYVAVSAYNHMPMWQNGSASTATFNLIRVLPGAKGYSISFSFFDVSDADLGVGSIQVLPPTDATGTVTTNPFPGSCKASGGYAGAGPTTLSNCTASVSHSTNDGKIETITIPIPPDYECNYSDNSGCWYRVKVNFSSGAVHDTTTWTAGIISDPVRLVE